MNKTPVHITSVKTVSDYYKFTKQRVMLLIMFQTEIVI